MAEINIYGYIGADYFTEGVTLKSVSDQLDIYKDETDIIVNISSGGGSVNEGKAIYNLLKNSKKTITVNIIGQAYSIASIIAMAGDKIYIAEFGDGMIHPAWVDWAQGNAEDLRELADQLELISNELFSIYMTRPSAKANETELRDYFDNEKFMNAQTFIDLGLADGLISDNKKNKFHEFVKYKAVAYYSKTKNIDMSNNTELVEEVKGLKAWFQKTFAKHIPSAKNASKTIGDTTFYYDGELAVGTDVFSDEAMTSALSDGTYGDYIVSGGKVTEIVEAVDSAKELAEAIAKVAELEASLTAAKTEATELNTKIVEAQNKFTELENKIIGSGGNPLNQVPRENVDLPKWKQHAENKKRERELWG